MELRQLAHFVAVADARSFTAAALDLGMSQPALSQSVARLERDLGCTLFERNKQNPGVGLLLTAAGHALLVDARSLLVSAERAARRARRAGRSRDRPSVSIGFTPSTPLALIRRALEQPGGDIDVVPVQLEWGHEHESLLSGRVDLAYLQYPTGSHFADHDVRPLTRNRRVAVLPASHPLARRTSLTLAQLAGEPILDPGFLDGPDGFRAFWLGEPRPEAAASGAIVGPAASTVEEMCTFVAVGRGMAIASEALAAHYRRADLVFIPIVDLASVEIGIARLSDDEREHVRRVFDVLLLPVDRRSAAQD